MKKRIFAAIAVAVLVVCALATLISCGDSRSANALQMNKKYIYENCVNSGLTEADILAKPSSYPVYQRYYVFHANGTGEYVANEIDYASGGYVHAKYTIHFKYAYADDAKSAVVCFFDSVEDDSVNVTTNETYTHDFSNWSRLLMVSKDVACIAGTGGYFYYINEDFVKKIPNYNKAAE